MFENRLVILRKKKGLSYANIASAVGKSESAVRSWEYGKTKPELETIITLAKYFECTTDYLLGLQPCEAEQHELEALLNENTKLKEENFNMKKALHFIAHHASAVFNEALNEAAR